MEGLVNSTLQSASSMTLPPMPFATLLLALFTNAVAKDADPAVSLRYSCFDKPFMSVGVSTVKRDSFPAVELRLVDPLKRPFGAGNKAERNPKTQYGKVVQVPERKDRSSVVAVEICDAIPGDYALTITEQSDEQYRLTVEAGAVISTWFSSRRGGTCRYRFRVKAVDHELDVNWLEIRGQNQTASADAECEYSLPRPK